ncbi:xanthine dehydrogenase family protein molybdopterin-binding subunit [Oscillibacter sp. GMB15532]|uniref:xanthine dehydrogenase family protein molybdopterin-binding subunit n=1 Tax=Oscillibacter sp. GMB15532 TaxID=3230022 RepID=UPI0034DDF634
MKLIGKDKPIHDARGKAAGFVKYAGDVTLPNMAYIALVHSTIPHGCVKEVRTERALGVPGVYGVFHCFNTTARTYNRYRSNFAQNLPGEERVFTDYVRFVGDRVAAVAACDQETADKAARLVEVTYEELPFSIGFDDTLSGRNCLAGERPVRDEFFTEIGTQPDDDGLIEVTTVSEMPRLHHATMEPHACVVDCDPYQQQLTVYSPNQAVHGIRLVLADFLEMPYHRVRVVKTTMGGSFGAKQEWFLEPAAALIAKTLGRPVKLVYSREEAMVCSVVRGAMRGEVRSKFKPDGTLISLSMDVLLDAGAYIGNAADYIRALSGKPFRCYRIPYFRFCGRVISSNTPVSGAFRSWSAAEEAIMMERNFDEAARQLGIERIELRLKNVLLSGEADRKSGVPLENIRVRDALEQGRTSFRWDELVQADRAFNESSPRYRRGVGVGCGGHGNTYYPRFNDYGEGRLGLNEDGTVQATLTLHDHGCGTVTAMRMIIAEVLDIPDTSVYLAEGDTAVTPVDYGCFASRTTFVLGRTAYDAATALRDEILDRTAELFSLTRGSLRLENGAVRCRDDECVNITLEQLAQASMLKLKRNVCAQAQFNNTSNPGVTGVHFAHVEVDTWTGFTKVLDYLAVQDIGQPINPAMCAAQIQGAAQMGCGAALREKMTIGKDGRCTESLSKYHLFLATDLPDIRVLLLSDGRSEEGPFGAKSIGEISYVPAAPAVCGAVNDALESALGTLPYDPDCILKYLAEERDS